MHVVEYMDEWKRVDRNRVLMARIILNTMVDAKAYPVDVSELRFLSPHNRALTTAFQEWQFSHRSFQLSAQAIYVLEEWANPRVQPNAGGVSV